MVDMTATVPGIGSYRYVKDPAGLTRLLRTLIWVFLGVSILSLVSSLLEFSMLGRGDFSVGEAEANDNRQMAIGVIYFAVIVATGVVFLMWVHRANRNCRGFGAEGMEFTPGWAVGYFFVPVVSLWKPFQVVREIWKVSSDPTDWRANRGSQMINWWWALYLISAFIAQFAFRLMLKDDNVDSLQASAMLSVIGNIVDIPVCIISVNMISSIFAMQERLVGRTPGMPVTFEHVGTTP